MSLDVHFVSPAPVSSPGSAGLQPGSRSHAGAWCSQRKPRRTGSGFMKQTSRRLGGKCFAAEMGRDCDKLLIGRMKRLVNRDNLCFHRTGPLVLGGEWIKCLSTP